MRSAGATSARGLLALGLSVAALGLAACGDEDQTGTAFSSPTGPGDSGTLAWALGDRPRELDPLLATTRSDQLVTRQIHEPLVESLAGPYGDVRSVPGLALSESASAQDTIWSFRVRPGVRFQDGTPLNAGAVLANGRRWLTTPEGQLAMPNLFAVDAPRPDLVRFFLRTPDPDFPAKLSVPQTGIVSPRAFDVASGDGATLVRESRSGTGPFELRERSRDEVLVARNLTWWGTERDLGPALDQVQFRTVADPGERLALLVAADLQAADGLGPEQARESRRHPLVEALPTGEGEWLGLERSVRGITNGREIPSLSGVWLTSIGTR